MARYIDLEIYIGYLEKNICSKCIDDVCGACGLDTAISIAKEIPAAAVVEVVTCGQCQFWKINPNNLYGGYCRYCECAAVNHYCSYGKRKGDT